MRPFEGLFGAAEVPAAIEAEHSCASQFTTLLSKLRVHRKWQFTTLLSEARPEKGPFIGKSSSRLYCRRPRSMAAWSPTARPARMPAAGVWPSRATMAERTC